MSLDSKDKTEIFRIGMLAGKVEYKQKVKHEIDYLCEEYKMAPEFMKPLRELEKRLGL